MTDELILKILIWSFRISAVLVAIYAITLIVFYVYDRVKNSKFGKMVQKKMEIFERWRNIKKSRKESI